MRCAARWGSWGRTARWLEARMTAQEGAAPAIGWDRQEEEGQETLRMATGILHLCRDGHHYQKW